MNNKKYGFSFVELLVAITIVMLISIVATASYSSMQSKTTNSKVYSDLTTLSNVLLIYSKDTQELPTPDGNLNFYKSDTSYSHDYENAFGVSGFFSEDVLEKKYINYYPYDERTNQNYAYGKVKDTLAYEVAGVVYENDQPMSVVMGNWGAENGPYNLIKEYAGPNFVSDDSTKYFPYNPNEKRLVATVNDFSGTLLINGEEKTLSQLLDIELIAGDTIEISAGGYAEINISDGSSTILGDETSSSKITLENINFKENSSIFTNVKLALDLGSIWVKASKLDDNSSFEVTTIDTVAAVRGTIFGVSKSETDSQVTLVEGKIDVTPNNEEADESNIKELEVLAGEEAKGVDITSSEEDFTILSETSTGNILNIPDEVEEKALYGTADFNENMQLTLGSVESGKITLLLDDTTSKFDSFLIDGATPTSYTLSGYNFILDIDTNVDNIISLCKDEYCTKKLTVSAIDPDLSYDDLEGVSDLLTDNDTDGVTKVEIEEEEIQEDEGLYTTQEFNGEALRNYLTGSGYTITGYAGFNTAGELNILDNNGDKLYQATQSKVVGNSCKPIFYNNDNILNIFRDGYSGGNPSYYPTGVSYDTTNSFFTFTNPEFSGIYLDNDGVGDYVNYTSIPSDEFAVEIGVREVSLLRQGGTTYTLFSFSKVMGSNVSLKLKNNKIVLGTTVIFTIHDLQEIYNRYENGNKDELLKIILIKNGNNVTVKILTEDGDILIEKSKTESTTPYSLYLGAGGSSTNDQWNDIIDYVKIYQLEEEEEEGISGIEIVPVEYIVGPVLLPSGSGGTTYHFIQS